MLMPMLAEIDGQYSRRFGGARRGHRRGFHRHEGFGSGRTQSRRGDADSGAGDSEPSPSRKASCSSPSSWRKSGKSCQARSHSAPRLTVLLESYESIYFFCSIGSDLAEWARDRPDIRLRLAAFHLAGHQLLHRGLPAPPLRLQADSACARGAPSTNCRRAWPTPRRSKQELAKTEARARKS